MCGTVEGPHVVQCGTVERPCVVQCGAVVGPCVVWWNNSGVTGLSSGGTGLAPSSSLSAAAAAVIEHPQDQPVSCILCSILYTVYCLQ